MRIGIMCFADTATAAAGDAAARVGSWLKQADHDVVPAETGVASGVAAAEEAARIARADCDAVILCLRPGAAPSPVTEASLRLNCPILLLGAPEDAGTFFEAAGTLAGIGVPFGRVLGAADDPAVQEPLRRWLRDHAPAARQRGEEAAQRLYGRRYAHVEADAGGAFPDLDAARWMSQFGVRAMFFGARDLERRAAGIAAERVEAARTWVGESLPAAPLPSAAEIATYLALKDWCAEERIAFCSAHGRAAVRALLGADHDHEGAKTPVSCAPPGDAHGALSLQLLHLAAAGPVRAAEIVARTVSGLDVTLDPPPPFTAAGEDAGETGNGAATTVTAARIGRRSGRFVCLLLKGELTPTGGDASLRPDADAGRLLDALGSRYLAIARGDHVGAMKAACEALDFEPLLPD
jgi:L-fucose isomerase-like protein